MGLSYPEPPSTVEQREMRVRHVRVLIVGALVLSMFAVADLASAGGAGDPGARARETFAYWTPERVAAAVPRDLVVDHRGFAYMRQPDGSLEPYGHSAAAERAPVRSTPVRGAQPAPAAEPQASPSPSAIAIGTMSPGEGATIGQSATFSAQVSSTSGVKQVTAYVGASGSYQSFRMSYVGNDVWQLNLQGFSDGSWQWYVEVRDNAPRGGSWTTSHAVNFEVDTSGGGGGGDVVTNARWTGGGRVQTAEGRLLLVMNNNGYVCSGQAVTDGTTGRSVILTAAHCVYDDANKAFATNVIFIPNQDDGGSDKTDRDCSNDVLGCWAIDHGVVDVNWANRVFPDNIPWDYAYYVVSDTDAHSGTAADDALDIAAGSLGIQFSAPVVGDVSTALGYSYSDDPHFMYCQEAMGTNGSANYWLPSCDLSGGSSGGAWMQPVDNGNGPVISVNSWGYSNQPGMAGPKLHDNSAATLFDFATSLALTPAGGGYVIDPNNPPGGTPPPPPPSGDIVLTVDNYKLRGEKIGDLTWSGAEGTGADIVRDGSTVATTANDGSYQDLTGAKGGGSTSWQVCEAGTSTCSDVVTVNW